jgi:predicted hydrocarbon binding protein
MTNLFTDVPYQSKFKWTQLGDIAEGRGDLGEEMPVLVYRLLQYTVRDVLEERFGMDAADQIFREAGSVAGFEFAKNSLNLTVPLPEFVEELRRKLYDLKVGMLRVESVSEDAKEIILTVGEDLDCSGLPNCDKPVCNYDEGFIAGILEAFTDTKYIVREIDCWATGDTTCRFRCTA